MAGGFITLHRQILDWEWYKNTNVKVLFLHLLLKANYKDMSFEGHKILRGQLVTSLPSLAVETGLSVKQIRGSLEHLISTGEVASQSYPRYRIITIVKYDDYQIEDRLMGSQTAGEWAVKGQPKGSQTAGKGQAEGRQRAASKQYNNINNGTKEQYEDTLPPDGLFDEFWELYPKKVSKPDALKAWKAIKFDPLLELFEKIMSGLRKWIESDDWQRDGGRYIPYPATWLRRQQWNDEVTRSVTQPRQQYPSQAPARPAQQKQSSAHNFEEREYSHDEWETDMMRGLADEIRKAKEEGII